MDGTDGCKHRRVFYWPKEAERFVREYLNPDRPGRSRATNGVSALATRLAVISGNPRDACLRFLHRHGVTQKRYWRPWTKAEQQRLFDLVETCPVEEVARLLQCSPCSIRSMLHRLGESSQRGREWFTPYSLAAVLHIRAEEVQRWIAKGWLKCRTVETTGVKKRIIDPDDFSTFVKERGPSVVGRRLRPEGLSFAQNFVFPPKHAHLLPLRKSQDRDGPEKDIEELDESA